MGLEWAGNSDGLVCGGYCGIGCGLDIGRAGGYGALVIPREI